MSFFNRFQKKAIEPRVMVIGLDCAAPELVFDRWRADLPNLSRLAAQGWWGDLDSCIPAITVPAWSCMLSSKDPGTLGIYGFRNRADHSYTNQMIATGNQVKHKRVWDYLGEAGKRSLIIGVPQTYPVKPINGWLVSDFLTPGIENEFTFPKDLKGEVLQLIPDYDFDVKDFRTDQKEWLLAQILQMTEKRFRLVDQLISSKPWDFFMLVEISVDRMHHGFWSYHDPRHFRYQPGNPFENSIRDYYRRVDHQIGKWLEMAGKDAIVIIVSDHGAKRMEGGICINEWLWRNGYLAFKQAPERGAIQRFADLEVDWSKTIAWGDGGYYGRVFLNVQGREPEGVIKPQDYERICQELREKITAIPGPHGENLGTRVFRPNELYRQVNGVSPDLLVYFGDLFWRSVGSLGHPEIYTFENDTGPDDCNHAQNGMVILYDPRQPGKGRRLAGAQLMDLAPTILELYGLPVPADMQGRLLRERLNA
jgi:predicted AlkP superfamily phosphohydrolase/phosphomutase